MAVFTTESERTIWLLVAQLLIEKRSRIDLCIDGHIGNYKIDSISVDDAGQGITIDLERVK